MQCAFTERFGHKLPVVFVDHVAGLVRCDFSHVNVVAFEDAYHLPDAGDVPGGPGLEPTYAETKLVTSEGSWLFQIIVEPSSQLVQFVRVRARDVLPLQSLRRSLKDSLVDMAIIVLSADDEADIFVFLQRVVTLKDEAFVLCLDEGKTSRKARENGAHAATHDLSESVDEREFFLIKRGVFGNGEDDLGRAPLLQLKSDVIDKELIAGNGNAIFRIEIFKVRKLVDELVPQAWVR